MTRDLFVALREPGIVLRVALSELHAAHVEIDRQRRMIADMREERERIAREAFGPQGAADV